LGGSAYGDEDRFVYTELEDDICFECCNEGFARQLLWAKKTSGYVYFKGNYMCTPNSRGAPLVSFSHRSGKEQVADLFSGCRKPKVDGYLTDERIAHLEEENRVLRSDNYHLSVDRRMQS